MADLIADEGKFLLKDLDRSLYPEGSFPIDARSLFSSREGAEAEAKKAVNAGEKGVYYFGQQICVVNENGVEWHFIDRGADGKGTLKPLGGNGGISTTVSIDPTTKHWIVGGVDTGVRAEGTSTTVSIDQTTKNWIVGGTDTGVKAEGVDGRDGETGVITPISGFFTMSVDADGNLYTYSADGENAPTFRYDSETGDLYFVTDNAVESLIGNVKGEKGDGVDEATLRRIVQEYITENGIGGGGVNVNLTDYYTKTQSDEKFVSRAELPDVDELATKDEVNNIVTAPSNGFFNLFVDTYGDLWLYSVDGESTPEFEYNSATGDLYFVTEVENVELYSDGVRY